ncbi:hypothetical protein [Nitrosophilus kaiyonis]|uniref:hypothetical protein n=1 Tax=Nitrosophilus kaiyonis TaxID=2930200 RepID=UPI00248FACC3|nr:hypothetical protein [Nitrosophilus kaiyonis]
MIKISISEIQKKPSIFKSEEILDVIDKRDHKEIGVFIPKKYEKYFKKIIEEIEKSKKLDILKKIKKIDKDMDIWDEVVDDGL